MVGKSLEILRPDLCKEWNDIKNGDLKPSECGIWSKKKVWWKCELGHEWTVSIADRISV